VEFHFNSWYLAFLPRILLVSILLSTPTISIKKLPRHLFIGLTIIGFLMYLVFFVRVSILRFYALEQLLIFDDNVFNNFILFIHNKLIVYNWIVFISPVLAWLIISFPNLKYLQTHLST
jgi:hypothetical protein